MSKSFHVSKSDRECTEQCRCSKHGETAISSITKRGISDKELISFLSHLCFNIGKIKDEFGRTVLHMVASCGQMELLLWLILKAKSNINVRDFESGYTPLHRSLFYGHIDIAVKLIKLGADIYLTDNEDLTPIGLVTRDRPEIVDISLKVPCQVYVWGSNNNYSIGTGTGNSRKHPELLNQFKVQKFVSVTQAVIEEFHSVFVSSCGRVWSCGHGQGGRLGTGNEKHVLTPAPVKLSEPCVQVQIALNHTLLLLSSGTVLSCGLNTHHQLGLNPYIERCLKPQAINLGVKCKGIFAAKYHSVAYTPKAVYTFGLNGGQLGHTLTNSPFISIPTQVPLQLNDGHITHLASSSGAVVIATNTGNIYNLHQFQCRRIASKMLDVVQIAVLGGKFENKFADETGSDLKIALLTSRGGILLWEQSTQQFARCVFGMRRSVTVSSIYLNQDHILFTTKSGEAFQGIIKSKEKLKGKPIIQEAKSAFHKFLEDFECYSVNCKKFPNIHRAVKITSDPKGKNFSAIQINPGACMTDIPIMSQSETVENLRTLLEEASVDDNIHDIVFNVGGELIPAHQYMLNLQKSLLATMAQNGEIVNITETPPCIFKQLLLFIYTGDCMLLKVGPLKNGLTRLKDDPLKLLTELSCKFKLNSLVKKLQCLRYQNGCVYLKDGYSLQKSEAPKLKETSSPELYDIKLCATDGTIVEAHKCILAAKLEYFKSMLMGGWVEAKSDKVLKLPFIGAVLKDVVEFIYTESPPSSVSLEDLDHTIRLLVASDQLLMDRLKEACEVALSGSLTLRNVAVVLQLAFTYNTNQLKRAAMDFIHLNLNAILESRVLEILDDNILKELSEYNSERMLWKYSKRVITPFSSAPSDEEIKEFPQWTGTLEEDDILSEEKHDEVKKQKTVHSLPKKKVTKHSVQPQQIENSSIEDQSISEQLKLSPVPEYSSVILTPPQSPEKTESDTLGEMNDPSQFPSLDISSSRRKARMHKLSPEVKRVLPPNLSQKQRKKLAEQPMEVKVETSPPKSQFKGWAPIPAPTELPRDKFCQDQVHSPSLGESKKKFTDIVATDREERDNWSKMKSKSFTLTQLEDKAMEELLEFYNADNVFDERIGIKRILPANVAKPTWITSHRQA